MKKPDESLTEFHARLYLKMRDACNRAFLDAKIHGAGFIKVSPDATLEYMSYEDCFKELQKARKNDAFN